MRCAFFVPRLLAASLLLAAPGAAAGDGELPELLERLAALPAEERRARLAGLAAGGLPRVEGTEVIFLAESTGGDSPVLLGDFNGWGRYPSAGGLAGGRMTRVSGTDWYYAVADFPLDARIEYGYADAQGERRTDPHNPQTVRTFGTLRSVLEMPGYVPSPWVRAEGGELEGALERFTAQRESTDGGRPVYVYLPPGYPEDAPYPVAYFHDGAAYVEDLAAPAILETLIREGATRPLLGVFVEPLDRRVEYRGEPAFLRFFTEELVPEIDRRYATAAAPGGRAIIGGSRGALGAVHLAWGVEGVFGFCGMLAPAITPTDMLQRILEAPAKPVRFHLVGGVYDVRFRGDYYRVLDTLLVKGYAVRFRAAPIGHSPNSWKHYIPDLLIDFFPRRPPG